MSMPQSRNNALRRVRTIADYQFGSGVGLILFPEESTFRYSSTGRIRYILLNEERLATIRASDGRLTLSFLGGMRLKHALPSPGYRVVIDDRVIPFIASGKNAMAKHVLSADPMIRAGDEVMIVNQNDDLIAQGASALSGTEMLAFNYGVAVHVRKGRDQL